MADSASTVAFVSVGFAVLMASVWLWLNVIARVIARPQAPLVPWSERRLVPWAFIDLILLVAIWFVASVGVGQGMRQMGLVHGGADFGNLSHDERTAVILGNMLTSLLILGIGLPLIARRTGTTLRDLGWSASEFIRDVKLGLVGFILLAPPVYALQGLLTQVWKPSKHPLVEMFKGAPDPVFFVLLFLSAAVVAPLFEELVFRVAVQGYLEKWFSFRVGLHELLVGEVRHRVAQIPLDEAHTSGGSLEADLAQLQNPYVSPRLVGADQLEVLATPDEQPELRGPGAWLPIVISSVIFALLHYSHGPDWIPLLLLAAGMGYLYQRTHRLLPSLVVHCLLNSYSLWGLWLQMLGKDFSS